MFHQFANYSKKLNAIWKSNLMTVPWSTPLKTRRKREPTTTLITSKSPLIQEILKIINNFGPIISKEMNHSLKEEVSEAKVHDSLFSMQKVKNPKLDELTLDFSLASMT